ncbi:MAG: HEAT repeat domain-containing protein, partial [Methanobacteriaceae archaeon]
MGFYDLSKEERDALYIRIQNDILDDLISSININNTQSYSNNTNITNDNDNNIHTNANNGNDNNNYLDYNFDTIVKYFSDNDTYIRKAGYLAIGRIYKEINNNNTNNTNDINTNKNNSDNSNNNCNSNDDGANIDKISIIDALEYLIKSNNEKVRQTVINSCGEIAIIEFEPVEHLFEIGLNDSHHSVRNAIQGSLKKAGARNHKEVIRFCRKHINNENPEIRRQVAHGLELRGRTHPEDIMFVLKELQFDNHKRVRPMVIHIFSQISYREGCLEKVTKELLTWEDTGLVEDCFIEIIKHHKTIEDK